MFANLDGSSILNKYFKTESTIIQNILKQKDTSEANRVLRKYPDRVPVIVTKNKNSTTTPDIDKQKFLVPVDLTMGQLMFVIRKRIKLHPEKGLFLFINETVVSNHEIISVVYERFHDKDDKFLHVIYSCESVFG